MKKGSNQFKKQPRLRGIILSFPFWLTVALLGLIAAIIWRFRGALFVFSVYAITISFLFLSVPTLFAEAPKTAQALTSPSVVDHPLSEHDQIVAYIKQVFGDQASNAFKILSCENPHLNPDATGHNTNGTIDSGIFQLNSIWANPVLLINWKTNIDLAYQIYKRGGWNEWACEYKYHVLDK